MNLILGYISTVAVILFFLVAYLIAASMANDLACASLDTYGPVKIVIRFVFVCWW